MDYYRFILLFICISFFQSKDLFSQYYWKIVRQVDFISDYNDVDFVDIRNGWIVGYSHAGNSGGGFVLHTNDGGENWDFQLQALEDELVAIDFSDSLHGWALGTIEAPFDSNGVVLRTRDAGNNWIPEPSIIQNWWEPADVCFTDSLTGWIIGNNPQRIFFTNDGGKTWELQYEKSDEARGLANVIFVDSQCGWVVGHHSILHTIDGGENWYEQREQNYYWLFAGGYFINSQQGWVVGNFHVNDVVLKTSDSGANWTTCFTFDLGYNFEDIVFVDSLTGWIVGENTAGEDVPVILKSSDGGDNWYPEEIEMQRRNGRLSSICCIDSSTGWAVGYEGLEAGCAVILKYTRKIPDIVQSNFSNTVEMEAFNLLQNYPNPFNQETKILFYLPKSGYTSIQVFDINGRLVKKLIHGQVLQQGNHEVCWDGRNQNNEDVSSGVYLCSLRCQNNFHVKKLIALK